MPSKRRNFEHVGSVGVSRKGKENVEDTSCVPANLVHKPLEQGLTNFSRFIGDCHTLFCV